MSAARRFDVDIAWVDRKSCSPIQAGRRRTLMGGPFGVSCRWPLLSGGPLRTLRRTFLIRQKPARFSGASGVSLNETLRFPPLLILWKYYRQDRFVHYRVPGASAQDPYRELKSPAQPVANDLAKHWRKVAVRQKGKCKNLVCKIITKNGRRNISCRVNYLERVILQVMAVGITDLKGC